MLSFREWLNETHIQEGSPFDYEDQDLKDEFDERFDDLKETTSLVLTKNTICFYNMFYQFVFNGKDIKKDIELKKKELKHLKEMSKELKSLGYDVTKKLKELEKEFEKQDRDFSEIINTYKKLPKIKYHQPKDNDNVKILTTDGDRIFDNKFKYIDDEVDYLDIDYLIKNGKVAKNGWLILGYTEDDYRKEWTNNFYFLGIN